MRAQLAGLIGGATLPGAAGVALLLSFLWFENDEPVASIAFLITGIVALGWYEWLRHQRRLVEIELEADVS